MKDFDIDKKFEEECCHDECCHEHHHHDECHDECCHEHHHDECHDECCHEHHHDECHDECCHEHHHDDCCHDDCCHEHHHCGGGCSCCAAKGRIDLENDAKGKVNKKKLAIKISTLALAIIFTILGTFIPNDIASIVLFVIGYVIAGYECIIKAIKNIAKGEIFDENFLMTIASIGAMAIGEMREGILVMVLFGIGEMIEDFAIRKSKHSISALMSLKQDISHIIRNGNVEDISTDHLVIGDIILVKSGEKVPVDGKIIEGLTALDNSTITGESMPVDVKAGDSVMAGGINLGDAIKVEVTKEYKDTTVKKIIDIVAASQNNKPKSQKVITKFAKYYTPSVVVIALLVAIVPSLITGDYIGWIHKALVFLVISCPCAIVISVPLAIFSGIGSASKKGVLIKGGNILENLGGMDVVAFDKTGTLTTGKFEVTDVVASGMDRELMLDIVSAIEMGSTHPIAKNIVEYHKSRLTAGDIENLSEIKGKGMSASFEGKDYLVGNLALMNDNKVENVNIGDHDATIIYVAENKHFVGYIVLEDTIKEGAVELISFLKNVKKKVVMLTGDRDDVAKKVALQLGIDEYHSELLPDDKNAIIKAYVDGGSKVMFVGDGINDAPSLASAHIGVCNNSGGNDVSMEAGDVILMSGSPKEMQGMFKVSKKTKHIVIENIVFSLLIKLIIAIVDVTIYPSMWLAVIADVGVTCLAILNSIRALK